MKREARKQLGKVIKQMEAALSDEGYTAKNGLINIKRSKNAVAYWASYNDDGSIYHDTTPYCHAGLYQSGEYVYDKCKPLMIVNRIMWENNPYKRLSNKVVDKFLSWLTKESSYAECFVTKGGRANRLRGYIAVDTDVPANLMAGALFATRMITEHYGMVALMWYEMVVRGLEPHAAFVAAHKLSCKDHENIYIIDDVYANWHRPLAGSRVSAEYINNFRNGVRNDNHYTYKDRQNPCNIHDTWGCGYDDDFRNDVADIREKAKHVEVVEKSANPFKKVDFREKCNIHTFMDLFVPYAKEKYCG